MAFSDLLRKFIVVEVVFILIKLLLLVWLIFTNVDWKVLVVAAFGGGILLELLYKLLRRYYAEEQVG